MWKKLRISRKKSHYFVNIELYTAQIFPLLPQQLLQWFQQQLQLDFEGGEGTGGSYQPAASKGAPTHCFRRDFTSREVGQGEATSRRTERRRPLSQSGGFIDLNPSANQEARLQPTLRGRWDRGKLPAGGQKGGARPKLSDLSALATEN